MFPLTCPPEHNLNIPSEHTVPSGHVPSDIHSDCKCFGSFSADCLTDQRGRLACPLSCHIEVQVPTVSPYKWICTANTCTLSNGFGPDFMLFSVKTCSKRRVRHVRSLHRSTAVRSIGISDDPGRPVWQKRHRLHSGVGSSKTACNKSTKSKVSFATIKQSSRPFSSRDLGPKIHITLNSTSTHCLDGSRAQVLH